MQEQIVAGYTYVVFWVCGSKNKLTIKSEEYDREIDARAKYSSMSYTSRMLTFGNAIDRQAYYRNKSDLKRLREHFNAYMRE